MTDKARSENGVYLMSEAQYYEGANDNWGICLDCGCFQDEFYEPDRCGGKCYSCGGVDCVGFEWALIAGTIEWANEEDDNDDSNGSSDTEPSYD